MYTVLGPNSYISCQMDSYYFLNKNNKILGAMCMTCTGWTEGNIIWSEQ